MIRNILLSAALLAVAAGSVAEAQSLRVRQFQQDQAERLAGLARDLSERCGAQIATSIDWSTVDEATQEDGRSVYAHCEGPISALRGVCESALGRAAVQSAVTGLVCTYGEGVSATLGEEGTYRYTFSWEDQTPALWHLQYMRDNL